jgi:hypothetical protein
VIEQDLPAAVAEHLRVLDIQLTRPVRVHAVQLDDGRWVSWQDRPRLHPGFIEYLRERKATKVELRVSPGVLSEFDMKEMVW